MEVDDEEKFPNVYMLKSKKLRIPLPPRYAAGALAKVHGLQGKPELNGLAACLVAKLAVPDGGAQRWTIQLGDGDHLQHVSVEVSNLELVASTIDAPAPSLPLQLDEKNIVEVDCLAAFLVHDFVEGLGAYPVIRRLARVQSDGKSEELFPEQAKSSSKSHTAASWSDLGGARLFYKMSLSIRCSEMVFLFAEIANRLEQTHSMAFQNSIFSKMWICCGFVTHDYQRLHLRGDFGQNHWQHSKLVHNQSRNHFWIEFPRGDADANDQQSRVLLDLAGAQFDIRTPGKSFAVSSGTDSRYRKVFEIPLSGAPVYFAKWVCAQNNVKFEGQHLVDNVSRIVKTQKLSDPPNSCLDAHAVLLDQLLKLESFMGPVGKGVLRKAAGNNAKMRVLEENCGVSISDLEAEEEVAMATMLSTMGMGSMRREVIY